MSERKEGTGGKHHSELPAAFKHEHSKSHGVGQTFAAAHGADPQGSLVSPAAGPSDSIGQASGAAEFDDAG